MVKQKKAPGRPKKTFISKKPKTKIKSGPGRPRKDNKERISSSSQIAPEISSFVAKSVDESKKKDMVIFFLFLLSFVLFIVSLYFTFMRERKVENLTSGEIAQIANIETGNINYPESKVVAATGTDNNPTITIDPNVQVLSLQQQLIVDFYQAVNTIDMKAIYTLTDAPLEDSNVFRTYYSKSRLSKFSQNILAPKIVVTNIQEVSSPSTNPNIKTFDYTLEYVLANTQQKYTEERSTTLIKKGETWKISKIMCETKGCSTMPFFNPDKYKNN